MNLFYATLGSPTPGIPPTNPTYTYDKYMNGIFVCDGNSLTVGQGGTQPYPTTLNTTINTETTGVVTYNTGVGGQQTSNMIQRAPTYVDPHFNASKPCVVFAWEITNDLYYNNDISGAITRMATYCNGRRQVGFNVFVMSVIDRYQYTQAGQNPTQYRASIASANTLLRQQWTNFADGFVDLALDSRLSNAQDTTYFVPEYDSQLQYTYYVHLTNAGYGVVADLVNTALYNYSPII